jgi:hypothetical protein
VTAPLVASYDDAAPAVEATMTPFRQSDAKSTQCTEKRWVPRAKTLRLVAAQRAPGCAGNERGDLEEIQVYKGFVALII